MATSFTSGVSAIQVGSYFVSQYYQVLQQHPDLVHQFYTDVSSMIRVDGEAIESVSAMLQIHSLVMSLNFTGIEIKTLHSLDSWHGGVLVMVTGSVQTKDYSARRKFAQTFFLAPQEKGYFVLNDIFQFLDEEQSHQHPAAILAHSHLDSQLNASNPLPEPVSDYMHGGETQVGECVASVHVEENDSVDKYSLPEEQEQEFPEADNIVEETPVEDSTTLFPNAMNTVQDSSPAPVDEPVGEPPKLTYASILRAPKGKFASLIAPQTSMNKSLLPTSEWQPAPPPTSQQSFPALSMASGAETMDEVAALEEGEGKSVYVRNLPSTISASEVEQEFKNFGRIKLEGVVVRNRMDIGVCYAFVEFEDALGVQNAIKASPIQLGGRQVHIEERRTNNTSTARGGRKGGSRGRVGYQTEAPKGRFGTRTLDRGSGLDGSDRDYNRPRGNGFHQLGRGILGNPVAKNGQNPSEATA